MKTQLKKIMSRLHKPSAPELGVFILVNSKGERNIVGLGTKSKRFNRHFEDYPKYFVGVYNNSIRPADLKDDVEFVDNQLQKLGKLRSYQKAALDEFKHIGSATLFIPAGAGKG